MPSNDFIPRRDADFRDWAVNYSQNIFADPPRYMMTVAEAESVKRVVDDFVAKYEIAKNKMTATGGAALAKQDARSIAESQCRQYAKHIKRNRGITDGDKVALGVRPINPKRIRQHCPQSSPILAIIGNMAGQQTLEYRDPTMGDSRDKPFGATALQLFMAFTDTPGRAPLPVSEAKFHLLCSRNPIRVKFTRDQNGKRATYYARWASRRGEFGPWSLPVSMSIAA